MNSKAIKILEYNKILERLEACAGSSTGKKMCMRLLPMTDFDDIVKAQQETEDALNRIYRKGSLSFNGVPDIRGDIKLLEVGSTLLASELLKISSVLTATLRVRNYGISGAEDEKRDSLSERFELLEPLSPLNNEIQRCIISEEEIADDASPTLKSIRRQMQIVNDRIREQLNKIVNSNQDRLQDSLVTMRNGRYCLPVKSEYKSSFEGTVHDQSSKGSTVFIEPAVVVKLNNDLSELYLKEQKEIEKILAELSAEAASFTAALKYDIDTLTELDFIFAKGSLAKSMKATRPVFNKDRYINLKKARHPLIDQKKVVPTDVYLGRDFSLLIITGPNTGGKTVTLKTLGLFTLMGQAGMHIPAGENSELAVFNEVFADIGDEQSIEQSLSTFSSHMTNIVYILERADKNSLCLFDELGAGTDPTEGAALAQAVLMTLHNKDIRAVATTHYAELKIFALTTPGVTNACMEFDVESLQPTYRLLIGIPGKSNAFEISGKLGLPDSVIQLANSFIGTKDRNFEDVIADLDMRRTRMEQEEEKIARDRKDAEEYRRRYQEKSEKLNAASEKIMREANEKARSIVSEAKEYADEAIKRLNKMGADMSLKDMEAERSALRDRLGENERALAVKKQQPKAVGTAPKEILAGDVVRLLTLNITGTVLTPPDVKGMLTVRAGAMQTKVHKDDIEWVQHAEKPKGNAGNRPSGQGNVGIAKAMTIHPELNIVGMRVDEALPVLDKYLDDAYLSHIEKVTIIHGRGTGALKEAVQQKLKKTKYVKAYRAGAFGEGDAGVTIVEFR